jgi:uncharacterized membrane protein
MRDPRFEGIATTANIGSHPIHPMLIPFPIALLIATLLCDLVFLATSDPWWADAALWCLGASLVTAAAAALAGFTDFLGNARIRALSDAWRHMFGNVTAVVLALVNFLIRYGGGAAESVWPWGVLLSAVIAVLLLYTGWKGGELVYRYRVGVQPVEAAEITAVDKAAAARLSATAMGLPARRSWIIWIGRLHSS